MDVITLNRSPHKDTIIYPQKWFISNTTFRHLGGNGYIFLFCVWGFFLYISAGFFLSADVLPHPRQDRL